MSKSGVSASFGPRGLSVTAGKRGTPLNLGLPGTGLSYRERLDSPSTGRPASELSGPVNFEVDSGGVLRFTDAAGHELPAAVVRRIKAQRANEITEVLNRAAEKINRDLAACLGVHLATPSPTSAPICLPAFDSPAPQPPTREALSLMDKLLFRAGEIEQDYAAAQARHDLELAAWQAERDAHEKERAEVDKAFRLAAKGYSAHMEAALDLVLSGIAWPKQTQVAYLFSHDNSGIAVDVDLPDEDETPRISAEVRTTGKLAMKKRSDAQCRRDVVALAFASLFRVAGEVFAALPAIERVLVSGYIQRIDQATGHPYDEYVISAIIDRAQWQRIDFERLHAVDPAATFATFDARFGLDRSSRFKPIQPYDIEDLG
ncbi:DUF4236 domain-containing protein [Stutzerimonas stutzeri]|uniref:DUF4236 domain-containing protein n=1 Tax=Stutzerimonas stutzeri TaxID=316 RepID=UPI0030134FC5